VNIENLGLNRIVISDLIRNQSNYSKFLITYLDIVQCVCKEGTVSVRKCGCRPMVSTLDSLY